MTESAASSASTAFDDVLAANREFAASFRGAGVPGTAARGLCILTCMDCRVDPLRLTGMGHGDAKVLRNPGGTVTERMMVALVLSAHLLDVHRIMIIQHTKCAMASSTEAQFRERLAASSGQDTSWMPIGMTDDQRATIAADVHKVRVHPLIPADVSVGGFIYDVDTALLEAVA